MFASIIIVQNHLSLESNQMKLFERMILIQPKSRLTHTLSINNILSLLPQILFKKKKEVTRCRIDSKLTKNPHSPFFPSMCRIDKWL